MNDSKDDDKQRPDDEVENVEATQRPDEAEGEDDEIERVYTEPEVRERVEAAREEAQQRYLRVLAEYDNFRKRTQRERAQWSAEAVNDFVKDLLSVFDSFDRALAIETDDAQAMRDGLMLTKRQLDAALEKNGIRAVDPQGETFDPNLHEALTRAPSPDHEEGTVMEVFEKGYLNGERLVRAARVVVSAGKPA